MLRNFLKRKSNSRKNPVGKIDFEILDFIQNRFQNQEANSQIKIQKKQVPKSKYRFQNQEACSEIRT